MKKFLAIVLAVLMLLTMMVSCGKKDPNKNEEGPEAITKFSNFPTLTYLYNTSEGHKVIGEYLQSALANFGITMNLENQEWNTFLNTRKDGNYSIARNGWLADYNDPICFLDMWTSGSGNNDVQFGKGAHATLKMYNLDLTAYASVLGDKAVKVTNGTWAETYDVLISTIKGCTDKDTRYALMHIAEDMLMATGCIVPLYYYTDLYMVDDSVKGFFSNPLGYKYFMYTTVEGKTTLDVCLSSEPDTIDPALNSAVDGATMLAHLFSGLAKWSQDANGNLVIVADAATELVEGVKNADGTVTYTYTLKSGMKWSNGADVTAEDFEYAWKRAASAELGADYGYMFEVIKGYGTENKDDLAVEALDATTLQVTLANDVSYWNELLAFPTYYPVYAPAVEAVDEDGEPIEWAAEPETYVCNGAYTISAWTHNSVITLTKNANFHGAAEVTMPEIKCHLSDDANNMLANFKNGSWLLIDDVPTNEIANLKKDYAGEFVIAGQIGTYYVCWNINENILPEGSTLTGVEAEKAQAEIRNAISLLFDRNYIVNDVAQGGQLPASSFVAMGMTDADGKEFYKNAGSTTDSFDGYYDVSEEAFEANVEKALEILRKYYK